MSKSTPRETQEKLENAIMIKLLKEIESTDSLSHRRSDLIQDYRSFINAVGMRKQINELE